jgi:cytochrome c551/c552
MLKVLITAMLGLGAGIVVMVIVIVAAGTDTSNSSSVGLGALPVTTAATTPATSTSSATSSGTSGSSSGGGGNAASGKAIFTGSAGCGSCHTLTAAGTSGTIGPNLDNISADVTKSGEPLAQFISDSITDPNKYIAAGFHPNIMPGTFSQSLSSTDIADLVALISQSQSK